MRLPGRPVPSRRPLLPHLRQGRICPPTRRSRNPCASAPSLLVTACVNAFQVPLLLPLSEDTILAKSTACARPGLQIAGRTPILAYPRLILTRLTDPAMIAFSVLDLSPIVEGATAADALRNSL